MASLQSQLSNKSKKVLLTALKYSLFYYNYTAPASLLGDFEVSDGDCTNKKYLILGHNLSPGLIQRCGTICVAGKNDQGHTVGHGRKTTAATGKYIQKKQESCEQM